MIHVSVTHTESHKDDPSIFEVASIRITKLESHDDGTADYQFELGVDTADGFAVYQRDARLFPRKKLNTLALLRLALSTLEEEELSLDGDIDQPRSSRDARSSRYLAREIGRTLFQP